MIRNKTPQTLPLTSSSLSSYTKFDDLLILIENEKRIMNEMEEKSFKPQMRLCGGGEDSLNNGTNAWGAPSVANQSGASWGPPNQQPPQNWSNPQQSQQQQQQQQRQQSQDQCSTTKAPMGPTNNSNNPNSVNPGGAWNQPMANNPNTNQPPPVQPQQPPQQQPPSNNTSPQNVQNAGPPAEVSSTAAAKMEILNSMREALFSQDGWSSQNVNQDTTWEVPASPEPGKNENTTSAGIPILKANTGTELWEANLRNGGPVVQQPVQPKTWCPTTNIGGTWGEGEDNEESSGNVWTGNSSSMAGQQQQQQAQPNQWGQPAASAWSGSGPNVPNVAPIKKENDWGGNNIPAGVNNWPNGQPPAQNPVDMDMRNMRIAGALDNNREIRGDPRGISGRLNGNNGMWDMAAANKIPGANIPGNTANSQWPTGPNVNNKLMSGWEDSSPPVVRRGINNMEEQTNLWGQNNLQRQNSNWKDMPDNNLGRNAMPRNSIGGNLGPGGVRLGNPAPIKPDNLWGVNQNMPANRNGAWDDVNSNASNWDDKTGSLWNENSWNKNKPGGNLNQMWPTDPVENLANDWNAHNLGGMNNPNKMNQGDFIRNSKQFRMLLEKGFKKEEIELALRATNMNLDDSFEMLRSNGSTVMGGGWRDDHNNGFDQFNRFSGNMPFQQNNQNMLANNMVNPTVAAFNNLKFGSQQGTTPGFNQGGLNPNQAQPSTQQLRDLVQQIQMAVQTGYLNHQILNQPLAPQTLILLNQLLNNIKQMQALQASIARNPSAMNSSQISMPLAKLKSQIQALQGQIAQQQTLYMKQQPQQLNANATSQYDKFMRFKDMNAMPGSNFTDMPMNKDAQAFPTGGTTSQQSRLSQWKLTNLEKEEANDFSRAPGTTTKPTLSTATSAMGSLSLQDGTWSNGRSGLTDGWPDSAKEQEMKEWSSSQDSTAFTDLVPEFQPGKPWKGTQMKIEDDPTITPGSVARSPLSIAAAKESNLFAAASNKTSPNDTINISSSTWSFNSNNPQNNFANTKKAWTDSQPGGDLWDGSLNKNTSLPPPGIKGNKIGDSVNWDAPGSTANWGTGAAPTWSSIWLLLKNLTTQIDGSILRTLCMQHGPLQAFHLYLNHGIALCKYSSREEANKAQQALNNCIVGNTQICAESPSESDVQSILQHLGGANQSGTNSAANGVGQQWRSQSQQLSMQPPRASGSDSWTSAWPTGNTGANLWTPLDAASERGTPSSLNSFLPENLLGTELN